MKKFEKNSKNKKIVKSEKIKRPSMFSCICDEVSPEATNSCGFNSFTSLLIASMMQETFDK